MKPRSIFSATNNNISDTPVTISEFMIACSAQDTEENFTQQVPEMVRRLREIGIFNPTQPIRDQSTRGPVSPA